MTSIGLVLLALASGQVEGTSPAQAGAGAGPRPAAEPAAPAAAESPARAVSVSVDEERLYRMAGPTLGLDEALDQALRANLDLKVARARLRQAETASDQAWAGYLPQVTASGTYTRNRQEASFQFPLGYYVKQKLPGDTSPPDPAADPHNTDPVLYTAEPYGFDEAIVFQKIDQF
ncbi:MAG TPA: TolC family protein, partial [Anaeromyxobacteraceae bacterium]|nr:TolC family protein [Anaeromyxobacteraceae bacterium]